MSRKLQGAGERMGERLARARLWLRRVMPRVALAAAALFVLRLLLSNTRLYRETVAGGILGLLTFCAVAFTIVYYGLKALSRLTRALLWRVRRRLIITYLFVGLTPIVLLLLLGFLSAMGGSSQAMVRVVTVQLDSTERQTLEGARTLADALLTLPPGAGEAAAQVWLGERAALLRASLPGARVAVWRGEAQELAAWPGEGARAQLVSAPAGEDVRGVGFDAGDESAPLPAWLGAREEWSGFAYLPPPADAESAFGTPSVRAIVRRRRADGRAAAVLVTVPVSRALVRRFREDTGVNVRPFFLGVTDDPGQPEGDLDIKVGPQDEGASVERRPRRARTTDARGHFRPLDFSRDQFGDALPEFSLFKFFYPVFLPATNWLTGGETPQWSFMVDWSWAEGGKQFWSDAVLGQAWWRALYILAVVFLVLELLALVSAAWMTRAVTGTVHKLYRATEFIKRGDFSHRIRTRSRDQLGELAVAFNEMSANIESLLEERVEHERLEREIEIAAEVQAQLFPRSLPALASVEVAGECRAARGVAGDYYDFIEVAPGLVAFALGDVSGKGLSASLVMSNLQASLRAQAAIVGERVSTAARQLGTSAATAGDGKLVELSRGAAQTSGALVTSPAPGAANAVARMTASVNDQLCRSTDANRFATLFLALYDDRARTLHYTNAGHNAPLLVRTDGRVERLSAGGTVVGAFDWSKFEEGQTALDAGDLLVIFSDGLSEAQNQLGEEYGEERLARLAVERRHETVHNLRRAIFDEVDNWTGAVERGDDQTLVILKAVTSDE